ncbi:alkyl hydroperoxide reductase subunit F [Nocardioides litoris]|uniref:alkyl hydroperoxide reductase subunit F n=1 Tax=Nocardioides litoris TaxID=1926648 RepID=UPI001122CB49|nr:alkyl hydroperoxide reductase subunit F [Nocardioides litoris]
MLDEATRSRLATYLKLLTRPVTITAALDEGSVSHQVRELLAHFAESPLVQVSETVSADSRRVPSFGVAATGATARVAFAGVPLGHEFSSLLLAVLQAGGVAVKGEADLLESASRLAGPLHFETYFSQSCQSCPEVIQALNALAALNDNVTHTAVEGSAFATEVADRGVMSVPTVYLNGAAFSHGRMGLAEILWRLSSDVPDEGSAVLADQDEYDVLVIGGGPAGATAAVYAARKGLRTAIVAEHLGGQVLDTAGIENFPSVRHTEGVRFARDLEEQVRSHEIDVALGQRARTLRNSSGADRAASTVILESGAQVTSRTVVLATGARWRTLDVPGEAEYRNRGVSFCPHCDGPLFAGKDVAVVGGGNSGLEAAIDLSALARSVTLFEYADQVNADRVLVEAATARPNIDVVTGARVTEVLGDTERVTGVAWSSRSQDFRQVTEVDGVFVQIGLVPNTDWLENAVGRNAAGEVVVDSHGRTTMTGVFASGDCTDGPYKQIITAAGEGARASLAAFEYLVRLPALTA